MKINKLKILSIAICCLFASLWSEAQCMQDQKEGDEIEKRMQVIRKQITMQYNLNKHLDNPQKTLLEAAQEWKRQSSHLLWDSGGDFDSWVFEINNVGNEAKHNWLITCSYENSSAEAQCMQDQKEGDEIEKRMQVIRKQITMQYNLNKHLDNPQGTLLEAAQEWKRQNLHLLWDSEGDFDSWVFEINNAGNEAKHNWLITFSNNN